MAKAQKKRASKQPYHSQNQLTIPGFESPFSQSLSPNNRWVLLSDKIPWDNLVSTYQNQLQNSRTGAEGINPRVAIGAMIIKHMCDLSDRETVLQIQENMYMQYFIGYSSFSNEEPFDPSLFVDLRKRFGIEQINAINEQILGLGKSKPDENNNSSNGNAQCVDNMDALDHVDTVSSNTKPVEEDIKEASSAQACFDK